MASPKVLASLGVTERFRKLGWLKVTLIAGFLALVLVVVEFVRYENSANCASDEMRNMLDGMKSQYAKEHANTRPSFDYIQFWIIDHWSEAQSHCALKYQVDPLFSSFDSISAIRVWFIGILTSFIIGVITSVKGWPVSAYIGAHPEVVTNTLDLISFIFVTPQLLLIANATNALISAFGGWAIFVGVYSGISFIFIIIVYHFGLENNERIVIPPFILLSLFGLGGAMYVINNQEKIQHIIYVYLGKHLFNIGLTLFFISRLLALGFAIYK